MKKRRTGTVKKEHEKQTAAITESMVKTRKPFFSDRKLEVIVAFMLGITMFLSAWATWIGSLHSGIQAINFTKSNNMASEGTAEYNLDLQLYLSELYGMEYSKGLLV